MGFKLKKDGVLYNLKKDGIIYDLVSGVEQQSFILLHADYGRFHTELGYADRHEITDYSDYNTLYDNSYITYQVNETLAVLLGGDWGEGIWKSRTVQLEILQVNPNSIKDYILVSYPTDTSSGGGGWMRVYVNDVLVGEIDTDVDNNSGLTYHFPLDNLLQVGDIIKHTGLDGSGMNDFLIVSQLLIF